MTRWFNTKSNKVRYHALSADNRAECNRRIQPWIYRDQTVETVGHHGDELPIWAELCTACNAAITERKNANQDKFSDWEDGGTELELNDNGDSISVTTRLSGKSGTVELDVRIRPGDLDRLERRIREIREGRGI